MKLSSKIEEITERGEQDSEMLKDFESRGLPSRSMNTEKQSNKNKNSQNQCEQEDPLKVSKDQRLILQNQNILQKSRTSNAASAAVFAEMTNSLNRTQTEIVNRKDMMPASSGAITS